MNLTGFALVGIGAALGAWGRWMLGLALNSLHPALPMGTLAANLIGGYLMGVVLGLFEQMPSLPPELRLLLATGFLGGLTTFSAFSGEMSSLLMKQQYGWLAGGIALHVGGSILMTLLGLLTVSTLRG